MVPAFICMISSLATIFIVCEFGHQLTSQFNAFDDKLFQSNWYSYPIEVQRMLVTVMATTQQLAYIEGFGNIQCTRNSFKEVCLQQTFAAMAIDSVLMKIYKTTILFISLRQFIQASPTL